MSEQPTPDPEYDPPTFPGSEMHVDAFAGHLTCPKCKARVVSLYAKDGAWNCKECYDKGGKAKA